MNIKTQISRLLRKEQTKAEARLWAYLRHKKFENLKFRRQHPIKDYIVDFVNLEYQIIIELDGGYHNGILQKGKDELRDTHLEALGYKVIRFENKVVFDHPELILDSIRKNIKSSDSPPLPEGEGWGEGSDEKTLAQESRNTKPTILSTKKLSTNQKELLLNAGLGFVEYNAINIELLENEIKGEIQNVIFTSKNAVRSVFNEKSQSLSLFWKKTGVRVFCVGENTKKLLQENGQNVVEIAQNASDLGQIIAKKYKNDAFVFFCGNVRRDELPNILSQNKIDFKEGIVYKTTLNTKNFKRSFDGILFFSPSGVQSYISENKIENSIAFCIGNTTASEARKHTNSIVIANKPTVENVIVQAVKYFNKKKKVVPKNDI